MKITKEILKSYQINKRYKNELLLEYQDAQTNNENLQFLDKEIKLITNQIETIENSIMSLKQPSKSILHFRYISNMSYENIATKLNYSLQRIYQLLNIAIKDFEIEYQKRTQIDCSNN